MATKQDMINRIYNVLHNEGYEITKKMLKVIFPDRYDPKFYGVFVNIAPGDTHNARVVIERRLAALTGPRPALSHNMAPVGPSPAPARPRPQYRYKCTNCGAFEHSGGAYQCPSCGEPYFAK